MFLRLIGFIFGDLLSKLGKTQKKRLCPDLVETGWNRKWKLSFATLLLLFLPLPARSGVMKGTSTSTVMVGAAELIYVVISLFSRIPLFKREKETRRVSLPAKIIFVHFSLAKSIRFYLCISLDRRLAMLTLCHFRSSLRRSRFHSVIDVAGKHNTIPFTRLAFWRMKPMEGLLLLFTRTLLSVKPFGLIRMAGTFRDWIKQMN